MLRLLADLPAELAWLRNVPWGYRKLLNYLYHRYKKPIFCTENVGNDPLSHRYQLRSGLGDQRRVGTVTSRSVSPRAVDKGCAHCQNWCDPQIIYSPD